MGLGWIVPIVVIGAIVWAIVAIARSRSGGPGGDIAAADRSQAILEERYARGELSREQFEEMRETLRRGA
jgi:putative membrane protein